MFEQKTLRITIKSIINEVEYIQSNVARPLTFLICIGYVHLFRKTTF